MERFRRSNDSQDQYVLTVFLPLLAVAILACIGGCCYMERRRRRRKKRNGGVDPEELRQQQDFDDTASVISTSSTRRRHYLDPTPTTGRLVRGAAVRSNYSTLGEPIYEAQKRLRSSTRSREAYLDTDSRRFGGPYSEYGDDRTQRPSSRNRNSYGDRPLSRARSMVDVRYDHGDDDGNLRRTRSSNNLNRFGSPRTGNGYHGNQDNDQETENMYEFLNNKPGQEPEDRTTFQYNRPPSPAQSEWSVRTAPTMGNGEGTNRMQQGRPSSRPSSMVDFPLHNSPRLEAPSRSRAPSLMRSLSQPNLNGIDSKTYPQGILKKGSQNEDRRLPGMAYPASTDSGIRDIYGELGDFNGRSSVTRQSDGLHTDGSANMRPSSRPPSVMSYGGRRQNYDSYFAPRYGNYSPGPHQQYGYGQPPPYSNSQSYHHHQMPITDKYANSYDPYAGGYSDYWNHQPHQRHRMPMY